VLAQAGEITENRTELGKETSLKMLLRCEDALRELIKAEMMLESIEVIDSYAETAVADCDPLELQAGFQAELEKTFEAKMVRQPPSQSRATDTTFARARCLGHLGPTRAPSLVLQGSGDKYYKSHRAAKNLAKLLDTVRGKGGHAEEEEEDCVFTQETVDWKCPILIVSLTATGEHRPVVPTNQDQHGPRCVFSHHGITEYLGKKKQVCNQKLFR